MIVILEEKHGAVILIANHHYVDPDHDDNHFNHYCYC